MSPDRWSPVCLLGASLLLFGCAHSVQPAPVQVVVPTHIAKPWTGVVRVASGNTSRDFHDDTLLVEETVKGVVAQLGIRSQVECLDHRGDVGARGAVHARVRVDFLERLTEDQEHEVRRTLEVLEPNVDAFLLFSEEAPPTEVAKDLAGQPAKRAD